MTAIRAAVLLASSRSDGNTRQLVEAAFPPDVARYEDLARLRIGYYSYDQSQEGDDFLPLIDRLLEDRLWVVATPVYWYTMSAQTKTFLDRLTDLLTTHKDRGRRVRGKSWAVVSSGSEELLPPHFEEPFALTCEYLSVRYLGAHYAPFDDRQPLATAALERAAAFGREVLNAMADQNS